MTHDRQPRRILQTLDDVEPYVPVVQALADRNRESFGFLPGNAYAEAASKGRLWIVPAASKEPGIGSYLLFGGHGARLRVFQIYTAPDHRRRGLAEDLLDELTRFGTRNHDNFITARVAADLPANRFWTSRGFSLVGQTPGGRTSHRIVNEYALDISPSLIPFTDIRVGPSDLPEMPIQANPSLQVPTYAIDVNFLVDLLKDRGDSEACRYVFRCALENHLRLYVTSEFVEELSRYTASHSTDPVHAMALACPTLSVVKEVDLAPLISSLTKTLHPIAKTGRKSRNDRSDLLHLATCIFHGIQGFITRDSKILRHADYLKSAHGLDVLTAADIGDGGRVRDVRGDVWSSVGDGTQLDFSHLTATDAKDVGVFLQGMERRGGMTGARSWFESLSTGAPTVLSRTMVRADDLVVGLGSWRTASVTERDVVHAHILIDEESPSATAVVDHLLQLTMKIGGETPLKACHLHSPPAQLKLLEVAKNRGFVDLHSESSAIRSLVKTCMNELVAEDRWSAFRKTFEVKTSYRLPHELPSYDEAVHTGISIETGESERSLLSLFDFETAFGPGALMFPKRSAVLVPIRRSYAESLLAEYSRQGQLFPRHEATLRLERAYFMKPGRPAKFRRGDIVVFYVSGSTGGTKEAFTIGRVTFAGDLTVGRARILTLRHGVLSEAEIERAAVDEIVHVFTFDNFLELHRPVPYAELKRMGCIGGANLVTAQRVSPGSFRRLVEYSREG